MWIIKPYLNRHCVETKIEKSGFLLDSEIKVSFSGRDIDKVSSTWRGFASNVVVS